MRLFHVALFAVAASLIVVLSLFTSLTGVCAVNVVESDELVVKDLAVSDSDSDWHNFKIQFNKAYGTVEVDNYRFQIFKKNLIQASALNLENPLATFGVNRFSDLSPTEFKKQYLGYRPQAQAGTKAVQRMSRPVKTDGAAAAVNRPPHWPMAANVDWRTSGAVTPVKDQGQCGSCWAFSAVEGVESAWFLKHKSLPVLSPQQVVSCDVGGEDGGCDGGDLAPAFEYIEKAGLTTEAAYPYTSGKDGKTGTCDKPVPSPVVNITGFTYATPPCKFGGCFHQNETELLNNMASTGPASICVCSDGWQSYTSGIMTSSCAHGFDAVNHCVQLVGYNGSGQTPYWIVRNSWGNSWGEAGYMYLAYGKNLCGVANEATFATPA